MQMITWLVIILPGAVGCVLAYLLLKWGPMFSRLASSMENELQSALRVSENIQQNAHSQMKSVWRQVASVQTAIDGVRSLRTLTAELEEYANEVQQLSQHLHAESHHSDIYPNSLVQHAESSAKHLSMTANRARHVYQVLLRSVDQLASETEGVRSAGIDSERSVQELTGAVERVRHMVAERRVSAAGEPRRKSRSPSNRLPEHAISSFNRNSSRSPDRYAPDNREDVELRRDPHATRDRARDHEVDRQPRNRGHEQEVLPLADGQRRRPHYESRREFVDHGDAHRYDDDNRYVSRELPAPPRQSSRRTQRDHDGNDDPRKEWLR